MKSKILKVLQIIEILFLVNISFLVESNNELLMFNMSLSNLYQRMSYSKKLPIIFDKEYDISFPAELEGKLRAAHHFDIKKYGKVAKYLESICNEIKINGFYQPTKKVTPRSLLLIHTRRYLDSLKNSATIATIAEVGKLAVLPNDLLQKALLDPMRLATQGTIEGAELALEKGWAINLSGGYHHAKANKGGGFCYFADIPLAIKIARQEHPDLKVLIVDLDAHQGNGHEEILKDDTNSFVFDIYGKDNYPYDLKAREYIKFNFPVEQYIKDDEYLEILKRELPNAIENVKPDLIIYNAGTDVFAEDPIGQMSVSDKGIIERDEFLFKVAKEKNVPILMVLSGGYSPKSAEIISKSIENILRKVLNFCN